MRQKVEPGKVLELAEGMKRLNRTIEEQAMGMYRDINRVVGQTRDHYPETNVRIAADKVETTLRAIRDLAMEIGRNLDEKALALRKVIEIYNQGELKAELRLSKPSMAVSVKKVGMLWERRYASVATLSHEPIKREKPSLLDMLKWFLRQAQKAFLTGRLNTFQDDPLIGKLLGQLQNGTKDEQKQAAAQLHEILSDMKGIARSQVAYGVYSRYGNSAYMEGAHQEAERFRAKLKELGISEESYNANLTALFTGSALSACAYDPRLSDRSALPTELWRSMDGNLSEDKQIAILLLTDQYFKATTKEKRDEILRSATGIRDGTISTYPLMGNHMDERTVAHIVQSLVGSDDVFLETIRSIDQDSKFAVFAHSDLSISSEEAQQVMNELNSRLAKEDDVYWNSSKFDDPNWLHDETLLAEAISLIYADASNGAIDIQSLRGNKMAVLQHLLAVPITKEWSMDTLNTLEIIAMQHGLQRNPRELTEATLKVIVDRHVNRIDVPGSFFQGVVDGLAGMVEGVVTVVIHPDEVIEGILVSLDAEIYKLRTDPKQYFQDKYGNWEDFVDKVQKMTAEERSHFIGEIVGSCLVPEAKTIAIIGATGKTTRTIVKTTDATETKIKEIYSILNNLIGNNFELGGNNGINLNRFDFDENYRGDPPGPITPERQRQIDALNNGEYSGRRDNSGVEGTGQSLKVPQGLTQAQFDKVSSMIREKVGHISDDIVVQGSRTKGTAKPTSDIDIAIRVPSEKFDELIQSSFSKVKPPNPGSAKEKTMLHAIETGKIQSGEAKLSKFREQLQQELGMDVDISIIKIGGPFDNPPFTPLK